jgi:hypothetical protein
VFPKPTEGGDIVPGTYQIWDQANSQQPVVEASFNVHPDMLQGEMLPSGWSIEIDYLHKTIEIKADCERVPGAAKDGAKLNHARFVITTLLLRTVTDSCSSQEEDCG